MVVLGDHIVAFGGFRDEHTYEKINWKHGGKWELTKMNQRFHWPCVTKWNEESIFITGGRQSRSSVSNINFKTFTLTYNNFVVCP